MAGLFWPSRGRLATETDGTKCEADALTRGKSVDFVHRPFGASAAAGRPTKEAAQRGKLGPLSDGGETLHPNVRRSALAGTAIAEDYLPNMREARSPYRGEFIGENVSPGMEAGHVGQCPMCGALVDRRDLAAVFNQSRMARRACSDAARQRLPDKIRLRVRANRPALVAIGGGRHTEDT